MTIITAASFPTPDLALRSSDEEELRRVRHFAVEQVRAARTVHRRLAEDLRAVTAQDDRVAALIRAHDALVRWRGELAERTTRRLGRGIPHDASRFTVSLRDAGPNYDRIGYLGRLREDAEWDAASRSYRGGRATPAYRIMLHHGRIAAERFAVEDNDGETLRNQVTLPDGTRITGNSLVRGEAAGHLAAELLARIARRGADTSRMETGDEPMYVVTAADESRERMFRAAMTVLAAAEHGDVRAWQTARYLLYQAPLTKKGSDAVTRTFLVTVGAILFDRAPVLEQDVDLRCIVAGQHEATAMPHDPPNALSALGAGQG